MKSSIPVAMVATLALLAPVAFASTPTPPPAITAITPVSGPASGGTSVAIFGSNLDLPPGFACILPCPTKVVFDEIEVVPDHASESLLDVKTPAHPAGVVDITIKTGDGRTVTAPGAFRYTSDLEGGYETLLLPVYADGTVAGANGSTWKTDLWLRNFGTEDVALAPWACPPGQACPAIFPLTYTVKPGETVHNLAPFFTVPDPNPGRLLYVTRGRAGMLSANLRIADMSRATLNAGTEVPVVREEELRSVPIHLHNVPLDPHFRIMLRVYDVALTESRFLVNFYPDDAGASQPVLTAVVLVATTDDKGAFRLHPAWAQYSDVTNLLNRPTTMPAQLRAEVIPLTPGARFWAFISATNNDTQLVTLITPQ